MAELDAAPRSVQSFYGLYAADKLFVNRRYQRKLVWTLEEKQRLVESVLRGYPMPAVLMADRGDGSYEVIDGLQRLHSLMSFIENAFRTLEEHAFDVSQFPTAAQRATSGKFTVAQDGPHLPVDQVTAFLDYSIAVSVMRGATEEEVDDVFRRINTYGHRLSDQERRQAGVQDTFSSLVRVLASELRGDASVDYLQLWQMPSISIDLPMSNHGYQVIANQVFWCEQGVLRSTDLRDSLDEQCIADVLASICTGTIVDRTKDALDAIYEAGSVENQRAVTGIDVYGADRLKTEIKYCVEEILNVCNSGQPTKLRSMIFGSTTNAFPAVFAVLLLAFHEALVKEHQTISDYDELKSALTGLRTRIDTGKGATGSAERRKNINTIKGLIATSLVPRQPPELTVMNTVLDIENSLRRSQIELPHYELKQGMLRLDHTRAFDQQMVDKIVRTLCAIANNGPQRGGTLMIGVCDNEADARRVEAMDSVSPVRVGSRFVVGVTREAQLLGETVEQYFTRIRDGIKNSQLTEPLKSAVLANIDYDDYHGLGLVIINVVPQSAVSFVGDVAYTREGDQTVEVRSGPDLVAVAGRFSPK
jgi:hypothetical protein